MIWQMPTQFAILSQCMWICRLPTNGRSRHFRNLNNIEIYSNIIYEDLCKWQRKGSRQPVCQRIYIIWNPCVLIFNGQWDYEYENGTGQFLDIWFLHRNREKEATIQYLFQCDAVNLLRFVWFWANKYAVISHGNSRNSSIYLWHVKRVFHPLPILLKPFLRSIYWFDAVASSALIWIGGKFLLYEERNCTVIVLSFALRICHPFTVRLNECTRICVWSYDGPMCHRRRTSLPVPSVSDWRISAVVTIRLGRISQSLALVENKIRSKDLRCEWNR